MQIRWPEATAWQALGVAVAPGVALAAQRLALPAQLRVVPGVPGTTATWREPGTVALSPELLGPDLWVCEDAELAVRAPTGVALDRFRRATGALLEAVVLSTPTPTLWAHAAAADAVDRALPPLGWLAPAAWGLAHHPEQSAGVSPRRGAWWRRFARFRGLPESDPTPEGWAAFGAWCRDAHSGPGATLGLDLGASSPLPWGHPTPPGPLAHAVRRLPEAGGARVVTRLAAVPRGHTCGGGVVVVGILDAGRSPGLRPAGPVGQWALSSGHFGTQVGAARGVELRLAASGRTELVAADGFVGPPTASVLALAEQFGVSGATAGRWEVVSLDPTPGRGTFRVNGFRASDGTVHPRQGHGFALPASQWLEPVQAFLDLLAGQVLRYCVDANQLVVDADLGGQPLQLRFERVRPSGGTSGH